MVPLATDEPLVAPAKADPATPEAKTQDAESADATSDAQDTGDQAPPAKPEAKPEQELTPEQAAKREQRRAQNKLEKAYRKAAEERARADHLERQIQELNAKLAPQVQQDASAPRLEQFNDIEEYATARANYAKQQQLKELQQRQAAQSVTAEQQRVVSEWEKRVEDAEDKYPDFHQVVGELKPVTPLLAAIMEAGPDVAHYIGKNPAEAHRISALPVVSQLREIGKLEAKLAAEPAKPKVPSKAPAPISPVGGKSGGVSDQPLDTDDINTWMKKENARLKRLQAGA